MSKKDYTDLDKAIVAKISGGTITFTLICNAVDVQTRPFVSFTSPGWRVVGRRLQALRKAGKIKYQRKPEGWVICGVIGGE